MFFLASHRYLPSATAGVLLSFAWLSAVAEGAPAKADTESRSQIGKQLEMTVCGSNGSFDMKLPAETMALIEVPAGVVKLSYSKEAGFKVKNEGNKLYIKPPAKAAAGQEVIVRIIGKKGKETGQEPGQGGEGSFEATVRGRVVGSFLEAEDNAVLYHQSDAYFAKNPEANRCIPRRALDADVLRWRARTWQLDERPRRAVPEIASVSSSGGPEIALSLFEWERADLAVHFAMDNAAGMPATLTGVRVRDRRDREMGAELMYWDAARHPATDGQVFMDPQARVKASILLPNASERDIEPMVFEFSGVRNGTPFTTQIKVYRAVPMTELTEEEEARAARMRQTAVSVRALGGVFWLDDGVDAENLAVAGMGGVGVRVQKGWAWGGAIEAEVMMGKTGEASFSGAQGEVIRSASLVRVSGGVAARFGSRYIVTGRLGFGVQGANYDSRMGAGEGPGDGFEVDLTLNLGGGLDYRIGEHWIAGGGMSFSAGLLDKSRHLEGDLHIGYGW